MKRIKITLRTGLRGGKSETEIRPSPKPLYGIKPIYPLYGIEPDEK